MGTTSCYANGACIALVLLDITVAASTVLYIDFIVGYSHVTLDGYVVPLYNRAVTQHGGYI